MPVKSISYDDYVCLMLNKRLAACVKAWGVTIGSETANGSVAPPEYYQIEAQDDKDAHGQYLSAILRAKLKHHARTRPRS